MKTLFALATGIGLGFLVTALATALAAPIPEPAPLRFPPEAGCHRVLVLRAVDGDTVHFAWLCEDTARLYGINAPETRGATKPAGLAAKAFLASLLEREPMTAEILGREKYGRALLRLRTAGGKDVSELLIDAGHAKPYLP